MAGLDLETPHPPTLTFSEMVAKFFWETLYNMTYPEVGKEYISKLFNYLAKQEEKSVTTV